MAVRMCEVSERFCWTIALCCLWSDGGVAGVGQELQCTVF